MATKKKGTLAKMGEAVQKTAKKVARKAGNAVTAAEQAVGIGTKKTAKKKSGAGGKTTAATKKKKTSAKKSR